MQRVEEHHHHHHHHAHSLHSSIKLVVCSGEGGRAFELTAAESARRTSLAHADEKMSDAALNASELGAADARARRLSCPPQTREAFFAARREHLRSFFSEQGLQ
jgi:hypothetical protein